MSALHALEVVTAEGFTTHTKRLPHSSEEQ